MIRCSYQGGIEMKVDLVSKTYGSEFTTTVLVSSNEFFENGGYTYDDEKLLLNSKKFLAFLSLLDREIHKKKVDGWSIANEDYSMFLKRPHVGGNTNIINDIEYEIVGESPDKEKILLKISIFAEITLDRD